MRQLAAAFLPASLLAGVSSENTICSQQARGTFKRERNLQPASWLAAKRQQAAALQRFAPSANREAFFRSPPRIVGTGASEPLVRNAG